MYEVDRVREVVIAMIKTVAVIVIGDQKRIIESPDMTQVRMKEFVSIVNVIHKRGNITVKKMFGIVEDDNVLKGINQNSIPLYSSGINISEEKSLYNGRLFFSEPNYCIFYEANF